MYEIANVPKDLQKELKVIRESSDPKWLIEQLQECLSITIHHIITLATIVRRLDECDVELKVEFAMLPYIRRVAYGQMVPELLVTLQGEQALLDKVATLPIPDQESIAKNKSLKVMELGGDHRKVPPLCLTKREMSQVFGRGKIRTEAEQIGFLKDEIAKKQLATRPTENAVLVDRKRVGIVVSGTFVSATDMAHYLGELTPRKTTRRKETVTA